MHRTELHQVSAHLHEREDTSIDMEIKDDEFSGNEESLLQAMTKEEIAESWMKLNLNVLWAAGLWPLPGAKLYIPYMIFADAVIASLTLMSFISAYNSWGDIDAFTYSLVIIFTSLTALTKRALLLRYRPKIYKLVRLLDRLISVQENHYQHNEALSLIFQNCRKSSRRLTFGLLSYLNLVGVFWVISPLYAKPPIELLPIVPLDVKPSTDLSLYAAAYLAQGFSAVYWILGTMGADCFFASVMIHVTGQLRMLSRRINDLKVSHIPLEDSSSQINDADVINSRRQMLEDLNLCIKSHQNILRFAKYLESVMRPVVLMQFFLSVLTACVALYQLTESPDFNASSKCAGYLPTPVTQIFIYCWFAHELVDQGEAVALAAYSCPWFDASQPFKRSLLILMIRAQRPLKITAGGLYQIDKSTFVTLLKASYSYYTLLLNLKNTEV